jgi:hypothetical protein
MNKILFPGLPASSLITIPTELSQLEIHTCASSDCERCFFVQSEISLGYRRMEFHGWYLYQHNLVPSESTRMPRQQNQVLRYLHFIIRYVVIHHNNNIFIWNTILVQNLIGMANISLKTKCIALKKETYAGCPKRKCQYSGRSEYQS